MAAFDVTDSAMKGYSFVWAERRYLMKLALFPVLISFVCSITVSMNGYDFDYIKQSFLMLPSYFAFGWVMSHLVRLIYLGQRWPFRPTGVPEDDIAMLRDRAGGIMAGTVFFALLEYLKSGITALVIMGAPPGSMPGSMSSSTGSKAPPPAIEGMSATEVAQTAQHSPYTAVIGLAMIVLTIWMVRYLWLYIPAAAGFSGRAYLKRLGGFVGSIRLIGVWLLCTVPVLSVFAIFVNLFIAPFIGGTQAGSFGLFLLGGMRVIADMVMTLVMTAAVSFVIRSLFVTQRAET